MYKEKKKQNSRKSSVRGAASSREAFQTKRIKPMQRRANNTGMPDQLKSGVESLSGLNMDDVKVHYNSSKPAAVQAHAYTQGSDIHIAPGQQEHLAHEAWHVVQQKQRRVKPTMQYKGVSINDNKSLEREADVMGTRASSSSGSFSSSTVPKKNDVMQLANFEDNRSEVEKQKKLQQMVSTATLQKRTTGDVVQREGDFALTPPDDFFFDKSGELVKHVENDKGDRIFVENEPVKINITVEQFREMWKDSHPEKEIGDGRIEQSAVAVLDLKKMTLDLRRVDDSDNDYDLSFVPEPKSVTGTNAFLDTEETLLILYVIHTHPNGIKVGEIYPKTNTPFNPYANRRDGGTAKELRAPNVAFNFKYVSGVYHSFRTGKLEYNKWLGMTEDFLKGKNQMFYPKLLRFAAQVKLENQNALKNE